MFSGNLTITQLADRFDFWMDNFNHLDRNRADGKNATDNQKLLEWLYQDIGAEHISSFGVFLDLAMLLHETYLFETNPPPSKEKFDTAMAMFDDIKNDRTPVAHKTIRTLAGEFDHWVKHYRHQPSEDNEKLLRWLWAGDYDDHIKTYEVYRRLAYAVSTKGYKTDPACNEEDFNAAKEFRVEYMSVLQGKTRYI